MTKTKRQLRSEAVERLRKLRFVVDKTMMDALVGQERCYGRETRNALVDLLTDDDELTVRNEASDDELFRCSNCHCKVYYIDMTEGDCGWGFTFCPQCGGEVDEHDSRKIEAELGEPTNGTAPETNGIHADAPLADEPPEGDGATRENGWHLRSEGYMDSERHYQKIMAMKGVRALDNRQDLVFVRIAGGQEVEKRVYKSADMVERDYVSRSAYDYAHREFNRMNEERREAFAERDKLKAETAEYDKALDAVNAERDELERKLGTLLCTLTNGKYSKCSYSVDDMVSMVNEEREREIDEAIAEHEGLKAAQSKPEAAQSTVTQRPGDVLSDGGAERSEAGHDTREGNYYDANVRRRIAEELEAEPDTREKLEADIWELAVSFRNNASLKDSFSWKGMFVGMLNRQAAISEREMIDRYQGECLANMRQHDELQARVDERDRTIKSLTRQRDDLKFHRDNQREELARLNAKVADLESALEIERKAVDRWQGKAFKRQSRINALEAERKPQKVFDSEETAKVYAERELLQAKVDELTAKLRKVAMIAAGRLAGLDGTTVVDIEGNVVS